MVAVLPVDAKQRPPLIASYEKFCGTDNLALDLDDYAMSGADRFVRGQVFGLIDSNAIRAMPRKFLLYIIGTRWTVTLSGMCAKIQEPKP